MHEIISAREVARRLKRSPETIEQGLRDGSLPFGTAYRTAAKRWVYIIPLAAFERFMRGEKDGKS